MPEGNLRGLKTYIQRLADVPEEEWTLLAEGISERHYDRNQHLLQAGEYVRNFFFITKGLVRYFYLTEEGKEFNKAFAVENEFVGSFGSMVNDAPCRFSVQALEETDVLVIPVRVIQSSYDRHPAWERVGRRHAERAAMRKEVREGEFLLDSAEKRYRRLLSDDPALVGRVQQYHLASYLGITDVSLSRIRHKLGLT